MVWQCPDIVSGLITGSILPVCIVPQTMRQNASTKPKERRATSPKKALEMRTILKKSYRFRATGKPSRSRQHKTEKDQRGYPVHHGCRSNPSRMQTLSIPLGGFISAVLPLWNLVFCMVKACALGTQQDFEECKERLVQPRKSAVRWNTRLEDFFSTHNMYST